jgi:integrase
LAILETTAREGTAGNLDRTFGDLAEAWVEKAKTRNKSWRLQERRLEMHVLPKWRDRKLTDIRRRDVRELVEGVEGDVLPNRVLTVVKTVFRFGLSHDWLETSPADGIEKPKEDKARDRVLDMEEVARIWQGAEHLGFPLAQFIRTLLLTAQRRTEVASMRRRAVDLGSATWTLSAEETKSSRAHLVPLSPQTVSLLSAAPKFGEAYVFTTDGKTHISNYAKLKQRLDEFIETDGKGPMAPWTFHDLRRTAATHMVRLGVLEEVVSKVLNHASTGVTAKVYALHRYEKEKRDALDRWAVEVMRAAEGDKVVKLRPVE